MAEKKKLSEEQVKKIAKLARLRLSEGEIAKFQVQLSDILTYFQMLNEVDTTEVEPTAQTTGLINSSRADETESSFSQGEALSAAAKTRKGYFKVKAVL